MKHTLSIKILSYLNKIKSYNYMGRLEKNCLTLIFLNIIDLLSLRNHFYFYFYFFSFKKTLRNHLIENKSKVVL